MEQLPLDLQPPKRTLPQLWTPDDIFASCDQKTIEQFKEDHRVERKRINISVRDLAEYVSMWANTQPHGGIVFIGVANDGEILGCRSTSTDHINDLRGVHNHCPDARFEFKEVEVINSKGEPDYVLALRVYYRPDRLVQCTNGEAYVREGDDKRRLSDAEKREIRLNRGELDFESEPVMLLYPDDFESVALDEFYKQFVAKRKLNPRNYSMVDILKLAKLGKDGPKGFVPNIAGALMFAKDPTSVIPGAYIRVRRYGGTEEQFGTVMNIEADERFDGPLPLQLGEAERFIASQISNFTRLGPDGRFVTSPEYPREVWLEALVNAAVHRSYNLRNMPIFVKMFDDKLVVESPGSFLPPTTASTVYDAHNPRNPNLMWGLYYFDWVQCAFEGTRRMRDAMRSANLPDPIFSSKESGVFQVSVVLENAVEHRKSFIRAEAAPGIDQMLYDSLCQEEKMIVNALASGREINVGDAMLLVGKDWRKTKAFFDSLEEKGLLGRTPGKPRDRHRKYFLARTALHAPKG
jgi:ATP-dependent DNA helicase RecG